MDTQTGPLKAWQYESDNALEIINSSEYQRRKGEIRYQLAQHTVKVSKWSDLEAFARRKVDDDLHVYLSRLWQYCGLETKPYGRGVYEETWGADRYKMWVHDLHKRKELKSMIEGLKQEEAGQ